MTQDISHSFHDAITSRGSNSRFRLLPAGIYAGYYLRANPVDSSKLDLVRGNDGESMLLTSQGVAITEDDDLPAVLAPSAADAVNPRLDLVVCEYEFTTNTAISAEYKIIKGVAALEELLVEPVPQNEFQVPIGIIKIQPSSTFTVSLQNEDLYRRPLASDVEQHELASLKPLVDPNNNLRLYIQPGTYPNSLRTGLLTFRGGFTPEINTSTAVLPVSSSRVYVFGIDDAGDTVVVETVSNFDSITQANPSTYLLAAVQYSKNSGGVVTFTELRDLRIDVDRLGLSEGELDSWRDLLAHSAFTNMAVELFEDNTGIVPATTTTLLGDPYLGGVSTSDVIVSIDQSDSSMVIDASAANGGSGPGPGETVTVKLQDLIPQIVSTGGQAFSVSNFSVYGRSDASVVNYTYNSSSTSDIAYFTSEQTLIPISSASIVNPDNTFSRFFLKIHIPDSEFTATNNYTVKIFSVALFANLEATSVTKLIASSDALSQIDNNIHNLIGNPFVLWSRPNDAGIFPDLSSITTFKYPLSGTDQGTDADENQFGPDGWYRVNSGASLAANAQRSSGTDLYSPIMKVTDIAPGEGGSTEDLILEYRIPFGGQYRGQDVSFSCVIEATAFTAGDTAGVAIAYYGASGLISVTSPETVTSAVAQRVTVKTSSDPVPADAIGIGFRLVIGGALTSVTFSEPMAAWGNYTTLAYNPSRNLVSESAQFYERGRITVGGYATAGSRVQASHPVVRKAGELGSIRARVIPTNNYSENLSSIVVLDDTYNNGTTPVNTDRISVQGVVEQTGVYLIDVIYESTVLITRV